MNSLFYGSSVPTVRILVNGKPIKQYVDEKSQFWIEAKEGSKYSIEINNPSSGRVLAIPSVDGINAITGEPAELNPEDGYVIRPYSKIIVDGWRITDEKVKEFLFTFNKEKSYSVKLGNGKANLGIIGVALYAEKQYELWKTLNYPFYGSGTTSAANTDFGNEYNLCGGVTTNNATTTAMYSADNITLTSCCANTTVAGNPVGMRSFKKSVDFQAGTAKGKEVDSHVTEVSFIPGDLIGTRSIYYDSYANLVKRGIVVKEPAMPQAFKPKKYCKDI